MIRKSLKALVVGLLLIQSGAIFCDKIQVGIEMKDRYKGFSYNGEDRYRWVVTRIDTSGEARVAKANSSEAQAAIEYLNTPDGQQARAAAQEKAKRSSGGQKAKEAQNNPQNASLQPVYIPNPTQSVQQPSYQAASQYSPQPYSSHESNQYNQGGLQQQQTPSIYPNPYPQQSQASAPSHDNNNNNFQPLSQQTYSSPSQYTVITEVPRYADQPDLSQVNSTPLPQSEQEAKNKVMLPIQGKIDPILNTTETLLVKQKALVEAQPNLIEYCYFWFKFLANQTQKTVNDDLFLAFYKLAGEQGKLPKFAARDFEDLYKTVKLSTKSKDWTWSGLAYDMAKGALEEAQNYGGAGAIAGAAIVGGQAKYGQGASLVPIGIGAAIGSAGGAAYGASSAAYNTLIRRKALIDANRKQDAQKGAKKQDWTTYFKSFFVKPEGAN